MHNPLPRRLESGLAAEYLTAISIWLLFSHCLLWPLSFWQFALHYTWKDTCWKVILFVIFNISIDRKIDRQTSEYDTFVLYNTQADGNFVKYQLLENLNDLNGTQFRAAYHEEHFVAGKDIFTNIEHIMTKSQTALVVLSPDFLNGKWTMYKLSQAVVHEHQTPHFKVIFLLLQV